MQKREEKETTETRIVTETEQEEMMGKKIKIEKNLRLGKASICEIIVPATIENGSITEMRSKVLPSNMHVEEKSSQRFNLLMVNPNAFRPKPLVYRKEQRIFYRDACSSKNFRVFAFVLIFSFQNHQQY